MTHGTRSTYVASHCRCLLCRAAEARYRAHLRIRRAKGLPILGTLVSPVEARRRIRQLKREGYPEARIAAMAGWRYPRARHVRFSPTQRIRLATVLRIRKVAQFAMLEGVDKSPDECF